MSDSQRVHLLAFRADDEFTPCVDYVLRLFARTAGFILHLHAPEDAVTTATSGEPVVLLNYAPIPETTERVMIAGDVAIRRGSFFGPKYLKIADLPESPDELIASAKPAGLSRFLVREESQPVVIKLDLIAASFWFLSRYEEAVITERDEHGRFQCAHSKCPAPLYDIPAVNRWFEQLRDLLLETGGLPLPAKVAGAQQTVALTHDVDLLRKYRGSAGLKRAFQSARKAGLVRGFGELKRAAGVMSGGRPDPYDSFDDLNAVRERLGAQSTFFLQGGGPGERETDYTLRDASIRTLISRALSRGDEIAVHPSYDSWKSPEKIRAEMRQVGVAVGDSVSGSRQHYLRVSVPETLHHVQAAKLRYDSSLGFADRSGFRCGWSGCFHPFDVHKKEEFELIEIPLICMDVTLAKYEKMASEIALERMASLLDASETTVGNGAFVVLWHNILADRSEFPGYWDTFEYFFSVATGAIRFSTMSSLCDAFEPDTSARSYAASE